MPKTMQLN